MKAVRIINGSPTLEEIAPPGDEGVLVRIAASSICGSDLHMVELGIAEGEVLGHEFAGFAPDGTAVAIEPLLGCGVCNSCVDGYLSSCVDGFSLLGMRCQGGMAEQISVPPGALVPLPTGLAIENASLVEPIAVAAHAINRARVEAGDHVLVVGAGPIGLAAVAVLSGREIACTASGRHDHQRDAAERLGAGLDVGDRYDVVIDAVGTSESLAESVSRVRPRGRVGLVGTPWQPVQYGLDFQMKEIDLIPAMTYVCRTPGRTFEDAARILAANPTIGDTMITHRYPLDGCAEAFAAAGDRAAGTRKVAFTI